MNTDSWWNTNELRWQIRTVPVDKTTGQYKAYLQQKWMSGNGSANDPFKVEWRDVPTVAEEA
jgi:hypothetical protein